MRMLRWLPAYIGLGSNLDSPEDQVSSALTELGEADDIVLCLQSRLYRSAPLGPTDQPDFVNAVAGIVTTLAPLTLLDRLHEIENRHARDRQVERWGPRTLDLDLLAYSREIIQSEQLTLPHPGIAERNFVLLPWREIAPHYRVPGLSSVAILAANADLHEPAIEVIDRAIE